jgi:hypothetical protein
MQEGRCHTSSNQFSNHHKYKTMKNQFLPPHRLNAWEARAGALHSARSWFSALCKKAGYVLPLTLLFFFISCRDDSNTVDPTTEFVYENVPWNSKGKLLEKFGIGISKAMYSEQFRRLIRNEAIKRFNRDTDVLYALVKDVPINSTVQVLTNEGSTRQIQFSTLHEFLVPFFGSEAELVAAEQRIPLLTIFVPTLPEDSFSPELWDVSDEEQIPDVALALDNISYVPVIGREGNNYLIEPGYVPGYPIVALKENERVISSRNPRFDELDTRIINADGSSSELFMRFRDELGEMENSGNHGEQNTRYRFRDNNFDVALRTGGTQDTNQGYKGVSDDYIPDYLIKAYDVFRNSSIRCHRANIYYGLTPTDTTAVFVGGKYQETIATLKLTGESPEALFQTLSDSFHDPGNKDPQLQGHWQTKGETPFHEGAFELALEVSFGVKGSTASFTKYSVLPLDPEELFEIEWDRREKRRLFYSKFEYKARIVGTKVVNTAVPGRRWEITDWNIDMIPYNWYFDFSERDVEYEEYTSATEDADYATSFRLHSIGKLIEKIRLRGGKTMNKTQGSHFSGKTNGDDAIASGYPVYFCENVLEYYGERYHLRKYQAGMVRFSLVPVQVAW